MILPDAVGRWHANIAVTEGGRAWIRDVGRWATDKNSGWYAFREALAVGATCDVGAIAYNQWHGYWYAEIRLDRCWSVHDKGTPQERRFWSGTIATTPQGMSPPHADQHRPVFYMPVKFLEPVS